MLRRSSPALTDITCKTPAQAARILMLLGLLRAGPKHGYELHRIVVGHGELYTDLKKPTLYHLLDRLAAQGAVVVTTESGARGRRGERLVYALAPEGNRLFERLLRSALATFHAGSTGLEVAAVFLDCLPAAEARVLLNDRRDAVQRRRAIIAAELGPLAGGSSAARIADGFLAADHALSLMDAELDWIKRATAHLARDGARTTFSAASRCTGHDRAAATVKSITR
jgi:DNA-binding PadR family transcriptional regulator